jgi:hypothetical protein
MAGISRRRISGRGTQADNVPGQYTNEGFAAGYGSREPDEAVPQERGMDAVRNEMDDAPKQDDATYPFDVYTAQYRRELLGTETRMDDLTVRGPLPKIKRPDADGDYGGIEDGPVAYRYEKESGMGNESVLREGYARGGPVPGGNQGRQGGADRYRNSNPGAGSQRGPEGAAEARGQHGNGSYAVDEKDITRGWKPRGRKS